MKASFSSGFMENMVKELFDIKLRREFLFQNLYEFGLVDEFLYFQFEILNDIRSVDKKLNVLQHDIIYSHFKIIDKQTFSNEQNLELFIFGDFESQNMA